MFDYQGVGVGLWPGEGTEVEALLQAEDRLSYELTCLALADGWVELNRHAFWFGGDCAGCSSGGHCVFCGWVSVERS